MNTWRFVVKRAAESFSVILAALVLVFYLANVAAPNPASVWAGPDASPEQIQVVTELYHLDSPWYVQLYYYLGNFFTGKWGISPLYQTPVISLIEEYLPVTLELAVIALVLKLLLEIPLGVISSLRPGGKTDNGIRLVYTVTRSFPPFMVALVLLLALSYYLHLLPSAYYVSPTLALREPQFAFDIGGHIYHVWLIDNMPILNALLVGDYGAFLSALVHVILPALALALFGFGGIVRLIRNSMLDVLNSDFVKTARAKGLRERVVIVRHALRNSLLPTITIASIIFAGLMQGSLVVETIFNYYGIGYLVAQSLLNFDTPTLIASTVIVTVIVVLSNLVADILYTVADPRVRESL